MKSSFAFALSLLAFSANAQIPGFDWVKKAGSASATIVPHATATDATGNVYITGEFTGTADFNPGVGTFDLTANDTDGFVLKLDASGNFVWAFRFGASLQDDGKSIAVDAAGNVVITGLFYETVDFNPGSGTFELTSIGVADIFVLKVSAAGNFVFAKQIGGTDYEYVSAIRTDNANRIYVAGAFTGTTNFDPGGTDLELTSTGLTDAFLTKFEANGNFGWANQFDGYGEIDNIESVAVDAAGNAHIAGQFENAGSYDAFVKKIDTDGVELWGNLYANGSYGNSIYSIQLNGAGDVFFAGEFDDTMDFDPTGSGFSLGGPDSFVCRLTSAGTFTWAIQMGFGDADIGRMAIDASSNIFLIGSYYQDVDLDPGAGEAKFYTPSSDHAETFILKLNSTGGHVWSQNLPSYNYLGDTEANAASIAVDGNENIVLVGSFTGSVVFSAGICADGTLTSTSEADLFALKLNPGGPPTCFGVVQDPLSSTICMGSSVTLIAYGAGAPRVTYQWQKFNGTIFVNLSDQEADEEGGEEGYEGTNLPYLSVTSIEDSGTGLFRCVISGEGVSDANSATATLTYLASSTIPYVVANSGCGPGRFMLTAYGQTDGNYKWYDENGDEIPGEVNSTYTTPFISAPTEFSVAKGVGACFSEPVTIEVNTNACATPPGLVWVAQPQTTNGSASISKMVTDAAGNIYATGEFRGTVDFDPGVGTSSLTSSAPDVPENFLLKMTKDEAVVWVKAIGDFVSSVYLSLDGTGSIYLTGSFQGTIDFNPDTPVASLTAPGSYSMFITKFDTDGNFTWVKQIAGTGSARALPRSVASDANGVYITGSFTGIVQFDTNGTTLSRSASTSFSDIFICKLNPSGANAAGAGFAHDIGNNGATDGGRAIAVDGSGNIYSVGTFFGTVDFDPSGVAANLTGGGATDFYMHKLNNAGVFQWARTIGGAGVEIPYDIVVDAAGNSHITGTFGTIITNQTVDFDPGAGISNLMSSQGIMFALKLDAAGNYTWAKNFGGTFGAEPNDIALDASGNVLLTGYAENNADLDPGTAVYRLHTNVDRDMFLTELDPSGNFLWAFGLQSTGLSYQSNEGLSIATYSDGSIFTAGTISHSSDLDPGPCTYALLESAGNAFIQKVKPGVVTMCFNLQPITVAGCEGTDTTMSTLATGTTNIAYQWQKLNTSTSLYEDLTETGIYSGTTTSDLTIGTSGAAGNGNYRCVVSGDLVSDLNSKMADVTITADIPPGTTGDTGCPATGIVLTASGGTPGQYRWYQDDLTTLVAGETDDTYTTPSLVISTTYYVSIITNGCESSLTPVEATVHAVTTPDVTDAESCSASALQLLATGAANGDYRWYDVGTGGTALSGEVNSEFITPVLTSSEIYYVTIFDGTCESVRVPGSASIYETPDKPIINASGATTFCEGESVDLSLAPASSYLWSNGETTQQISVTIAGTYTATITNADGCSSLPSDAITLSTTTAPAKPSINASGPVSFCSGNTVSLSAPAANSYLWSSGETTQTINVSSSGSFTVSISDSNGCNSTASDAVNVAVNALPGKPTIDASGTTTFCEGESVQLSGPPGYTYLWSTGETTQSKTVSTAGDYSVAVTDANGCTSTSSDPTTVSVNPPPAKPVITNSAGTSLCVGQSTILSAPASTTYLWSTGATTQQITVSAAGNYSVQVTNPNGCTSAASDVVSIVVGVCNQPPAIATTQVETGVDSQVSVDLVSLISDPDNNIVLSTLTIIIPPISGATASINANYELVLDYTGVSFSGTDVITIEVCDAEGECTQQQITIEVLGEAVVMNGISPNGDGANDFFQIKYIDVLESTKQNRVTIFNRWGDEVFEITNYDNKERVFRGLNKHGNELPSGTYLYKIDYAGRQPQQTGYLVLKR